MNSELDQQGSPLGTNQFFQIAVLGTADRARADWFSQLGFSTALSDTPAGPVTILTGQVIDQAHLRGILNRFWDLNLEVIQVSRLDFRLKIGGHHGG